MANKLLKTLTLPNAQGELIKYDLAPKWENIEGKPENLDTSWENIEGKPESFPSDLTQASGILPIENGGTGNADGYIRTGAKSNSTIGAKATAEGTDTIASGQFAHAEGGATEATALGAHAEGAGSIASGQYSHAENYQTKASREASHAEGDHTEAAGLASHAEGYSTIANGDYAHAEGESTFAIGAASHAEGSLTNAWGNSSHVEGSAGSSLPDSITKDSTLEEIFEIWASDTFTLASGDGAHAEGINTLSVNSGSHAEGMHTYAKGEGAHAEGVEGRATGNSAHAEGYSTIADGVSSHAEGHRTCAMGGNSHTEGILTNAWGYAAHAEGTADIRIPDTLSPGATEEEIIEAWMNVGGLDYFSLAGGGASHIEGMGNLTVGLYAHAEGCYNLASNTSAHAEGGHGQATGEYSHVEGVYNSASGYAAHAEGRGTIAASDIQHVQGLYNIKDQDDIYAHIVGNGDPSARSNAHTLDWEGNAWFAGSITATKLILGPESYGTSLPTNGVEGQIFFLIGGKTTGSVEATDDGNGIITLG